MNGALPLHDVFAVVERRSNLGDAPRRRSERAPRSSVGDESRSSLSRYSAGSASESLLLRSSTPSKRFSNRPNRGSTDLLAEYEALSYTASRYTGSEQRIRVRAACVIQRYARAHARDVFGRQLRALWPRIKELKHKYEASELASERRKVDLESIIGRELLRSHPAVAHEIEAAWVVCTNGKSVLSKDDYFTMRRKVYLSEKRLRDEQPDAHECQKQLSHDWRRDSMGKLHLDKADFTEAWLRLADMHAENVSARAYTSWLRHTVLTIVHKRPHNRFEWATDSELMPKGQSNFLRAHWQSCFGDAQRREILARSSAALHVRRVARLGAMLPGTHATLLAAPPSGPLPAVPDAPVNPPRRLPSLARLPSLPSSSVLSSPEPPKWFQNWFKASVAVRACLALSSDEVHDEGQMPVLSAQRSTLPAHSALSRLSRGTSSFAGSDSTTQLAAGAGEATSRSPSRSLVRGPSMLRRSSSLASAQRYNLQPPVWQPLTARERWWRAARAVKSWIKSDRGSQQSEAGRLQSEAGRLQKRCVDVSDVEDHHECESVTSTECGMSDAVSESDTQLSDVLDAAEVGKPALACKSVALAAMAASMHPVAV